MVIGGGTKVNTGGVRSGPTVAPGHLSTGRFDRSDCYSSRPAVRDVIESGTVSTELPSSDAVASIEIVPAVKSSIPVAGAPSWTQPGWNGADGGSSLTWSSSGSSARSTRVNAEVRCVVKTPLDPAWWVMRMFWMFALMNPPRKTLAGRTSRRAISSSCPPSAGCRSTDEDLAGQGRGRGCAGQIVDRGGCRGGGRGGEVGGRRHGRAAIGPSETAQLCSARRNPSSAAVHTVGLQLSDWPQSGAAQISACMPSPTNPSEPVVATTVLPHWQLHRATRVRLDEHGALQCRRGL